MISYIACLLTIIVFLGVVGVVCTLEAMRQTDVDAEIDRIIKEITQGRYKRSVKVSKRRK